MLKSRLNYLKCRIKYLCQIKRPADLFYQLEEALSRAWLRESHRRWERKRVKKSTWVTAGALFFYKQQEKAIL